MLIKALTLALILPKIASAAASSAINKLPPDLRQWVRELNSRSTVVRVGGFTNENLQERLVKEKLRAQQQQRKSQKNHSKLCHQQTTPAKKKPAIPSFVVIGGPLNNEYMENVSVPKPKEVENSSDYLCLSNEEFKQLAGNFKFQNSFQYHYTYNLNYKGQIFKLKHIGYKSVSPTGKTFEKDTNGNYRTPENAIPRFTVYQELPVFTENGVYIRIKPDPAKLLEILEKLKL